MVPELAMLGYLVPIIFGVKRGKTGGFTDNWQFDTTIIGASTLAIVALVFGGHELFDDPQNFMGHPQLQGGELLTMTLLTAIYGAGIYGGAYMIGNAIKR